MPLRIIAVLVLAIAGCRSDSTSPFVSLASPVGAPEHVLGTGTLDELSARRAAWLAYGPRNYRVGEQLICFCAPGPEFEPAVVEVRDRRLASVRTVSTGEAFVPRAGTLMSVEELFDLAIDYVGRGERVIVHYDRLMGYPTYLALGEPERDAGVIYVLFRAKSF